MTKTGLYVSVSRMASVDSKGLLANVVPEAFITATSVDAFDPSRTIYVRIRTDSHKRRFHLRIQGVLFLWSFLQAEPRCHVPCCKPGFRSSVLITRSTTPWRQLFHWILPNKVAKPFYGTFCRILNYAASTWDYLVVLPREQERNLSVLNCELKACHNLPLCALQNFHWGCQISAPSIRPR